VREGERTDVAEAKMPVEGEVAAVAAAAAAAVFGPATRALAKPDPAAEPAREDVAVLPVLKKRQDHDAAAATATAQEVALTFAAAAAAAECIAAAFAVASTKRGVRSIGLSGGEGHCAIARTNHSHISAR
jgi:hypothetical protein